MKITFEIDTAADTFEADELARLVNALNMARALWKMDEEIHHWFRTVEKVDAEELQDKWLEILRDNNLDLESLYR